MIKLPLIHLYNTDWAFTKADTRGGTVKVGGGIGVNLLSLTLENGSGDSISLKGEGAGISAGIGISLPVFNCHVSRKDISPKHTGIGKLASSSKHLRVDDLKGFVTIYTASTGGAGMVGGCSVAFFTRRPFGPVSPISTISAFLSLVITKNLKAVGAFWGYSFQTTVVDVSSSSFVYKVTKVEESTKKEKRRQAIQRSQQRMLSTFGGSA